MTIREIAKIAQVSPAAVSIVLNNKKGVSAETRARILRVVQENNYYISKHGKKRMKDILLLKFWGSGMIVEENQSFVSTIIDAIRSDLRLHHCRLTMYIAENSLEEALQEIDFSNFSSAIVIGTEVTREFYGVLDKIPIPYIMVDNAGGGVSCSSVSIGNSSNVYIALSHLKEMGHRQVGYLRSAFTIENFVERAEAFQKWVTELEFDAPNDAEFRLTPTLEGAYKDMCTFLEGKEALPTCLFADNDTIAIGAGKALKEFGYRIPDDVSLIGIDDIPYASVASPALTTVRVQKEVIGQLAVTQLLTLLENPAYKNVKTRLTGELIPRSSVKDIRGNFRGNL